MRKRNIALIVAGVLILVGLFSATTGGLLHGSITSVYFGNKGIQVDERKENTMTKELSSFKNINVSIHAGSIELIKSDKNAIEYDMDRHERVTVCDVKDDTFTFKTEVKIAISLFNFSNPYIKIYYKDDAELENVYLKTGSGSIQASDVVAKNFSSISTSGSQSVANIKAPKIDINGVSGSIKANDISGDTVNIKGNSGSITINGVTCQDISIKNTSGSIKVYNADISSSNIKGNSGSIYVQGAIKGKNQIHNTSGSVRVYSSLPKSEYGYKLSSTSGSTKVDDETFKGSVGEEKTNFIDASAMSGSVKVYFNSKGE